MLTVIKSHVLHLSPCSGSPSSSIRSAGCSRSLTSFSSVTSYLLKCSIIRPRSFAGVACCSRRCVLRLTTAVQCCLHTSTLKSSKKHRVLLQFSSDSFSSLRRWSGLLSSSCCCCCGVGVRLSHTNSIVGQSLDDRYLFLQSLLYSIDRKDAYEKIVSYKHN
jgi:hypothetical protein